MKLTTRALSPTVRAALPETPAPAPVIVLARAIDSWSVARECGDSRDLALAHLQLSAARVEAEAPAQPTRRVVRFLNSKPGPYEPRTPTKSGPQVHRKAGTSKKPGRVVRSAFRSDITPERLDATALRFITENGGVTIPGLRLFLQPIRSASISACITRLLKARKIERAITRVSYGTLETKRTTLVPVRRK